MSNTRPTEGKFPAPCPVCSTPFQTRGELASHLREKRNTGEGCEIRAREHRGTLSALDLVECEVCLTWFAATRAGRPKKHKCSQVPPHESQTTADEDTGGGSQAQNLAEPEERQDSAAQVDLLGEGRLQWLRGIPWEDLSHCPYGTWRYEHYQNIPVALVERMCLKMLNNEVPIAARIPPEVVKGGTTPKRDTNPIGGRSRLTLGSHFL